MGLLILFAKLAAVSCIVCGFINLVVLCGLRWKKGWRYWVTCCFAFPGLLFANAVYLLLTFVPPDSVFSANPPEPDTGPLNFAFAFLTGLFGVAYLAVAIPICIWLQRKSQQI